MRRLIGILSISCIAVASAFGAPDDRRGDDKKSKTVKKDDTSCYVMDAAPADEADETPDTTAITFPSHDLYNTWDVTQAHPYNFAESFKEDSVAITLVNEGENPFVLPFKGELTSVFGWRRYRPHFGTDIRLRTGDSVYAAFDGMVRIAKYYYGYGNCVIIRHNNGLETVYAHLSRILVESGQRITSGTLLGLGGNTGHSFGSHLHFEIRFLGQAFDTQDLVDYETGTLKSNIFVIRKSDVDNKYDLRALHNRHRHDIGLSRHHVKGKASGGRIYYVRRGDCLGSIARRNRTSISVICKKNRLRPTSTLQIGQKIILY